MNVFVVTKMGQVSGVYATVDGAMLAVPLAEWSATADRLSCADYEIREWQVTA